MGKTNRLLKVTLVGGGRSASVPSLAAIIKGSPSDKVPDGYVLNKEYQKLFIITEFSFKAKLRLIPVEDASEVKVIPCAKDIEKGVAEEELVPTVEDEMLNFVLDWAISEGYAIAFAGNAKPTRNDFQFRLEQRRFIRDKKSKECTLGLTKI